MRTTILIDGELREPIWVNPTHVVLAYQDTEYPTTETVVLELTSAAPITIEDSFDRVCTVLSYQNGRSAQE